MKLPIKKAKYAYQQNGVADPRVGAFVYTNDIGSPKSKKKSEAHTAPTKFGMGDYYGTGLKAKMGKLRGDTLGYDPVSKKQMGTAPRSLA